MFSTVGFSFLLFRILQGIDVASSEVCLPAGLRQMNFADRVGGHTKRLEEASAWGISLNPGICKIALLPAVQNY